MQKILIVVDMQNDFVTGPLGSEAAQVAAKNIAEHLLEYDRVIFTRDTHDDDYLDTLEGKFLPVPHCIEGSEGHEVIPELMNIRSWHQEVSTLDKYSFGSFSWIGAFNSFDCEAIEICGVCTDICVISNALILRSIFKNKRIICHKDWCAGTTKEAHEAALEVMKSCQIEVI